VQARQRVSRDAEDDISPTTNQPNKQNGKKGTPPLTRPDWASRVQWVRGSALEPRTYAHLLPGAVGAVSCVGGFGSTSRMLTVNGAANAAAIAAAAEAGVPRFALVSAHVPAVPGFDYLMEGYV
jgi:uncharacterized protein YbjT (DUF2867 family)